MQISHPIYCMRNLYQSFLSSQIFPSDAPAGIALYSLFSQTFGRQVYWQGTGLCNGSAHLPSGDWESLSILFIKSDLRLAVDLQDCVKAQQNAAYANKVHG